MCWNIAKNKIWNSFIRCALILIDIWIGGSVHQLFVTGWMFLRSFVETSGPVGGSGDGICDGHDFIMRHFSDILKLEASVFQWSLVTAHVNSFKVWNFCFGLAKRSRRREKPFLPLKGFGTFTYAWNQFFSKLPRVPSQHWQKQLWSVYITFNCLLYLLWHITIHYAH